MNFKELSRIIQDVHQAFSRQAGHSVNMALTLRNWLIGQYIKEYELNGADRVKYASNALQKLADELQLAKIPSTAYTSLKQYRQFYETYPQIRQTASGELSLLINLKELPLSIRQTPSGESKAVKQEVPALEPHKNSSLFFLTVISPNL